MATPIRYAPNVETVGARLPGSEADKTQDQRLPIRRAAPAIRRDGVTAMDKDAGRKPTPNNQDRAKNAACDERKNTQPPISDEPPIEDREELPGTPRPAAD